jgi:hypothetical protein
VVETAETDPASLPLQLKNAFPYLQRFPSLRSFHTGMNQLRDAGSPVTRFSLGPKWLMQPLVVATSLEAIRDILTKRTALSTKSRGCSPSFAA